MTFYEVTLILEDKQQERLTILAEYFRNINHWEEKDILQFAITALPDSIYLMLKFMEIKIEQLENKNN